MKTLPPHPAPCTPHLEPRIRLHPHRAPHRHVHHAHPDGARRPADAQAQEERQRDLRRPDHAHHRRAEVSYNAAYPATGFACPLSALGGDPKSGAPSAQAAQLHRSRRSPPPDRSPATPSPSPAAARSPSTTRTSTPPTRSPASPRPSARPATAATAPTRTTSSSSTPPAAPTAP